MVLFLLVTVIALPVSISFYHDDKPVSWIVLNCVTDILFLVDIVFNFRTGVIVLESSDKVRSRLSRINVVYDCVKIVGSVTVAMS